MNSLQASLYRSKMRAFNLLLEAARDRRIFLRNKIPLRTKIQACLLYMAGLSYRGMTYQTRRVNASHVSVFSWVHALKGIVSRVPRKERRVVAMDETVL